MLRLIYRARSITFEVISVLMISAAMNVLTNLLPDVHGGYIDSTSSRVFARLTLALTALAGGVLIFIVGRKVAVVEEHERFSLQRASSCPELVTEDQVREAFKIQFIRAPVVLSLFIAGSVLFLLDVVLMWRSFLGKP